jgi:hypothetical protein
MNEKPIKYTFPPVADGERARRAIQEEMEDELVRLQREAERINSRLTRAFNGRIGSDGVRRYASPSPSFKQKGNTRCMFVLGSNNIT